MNGTFSSYQQGVNKLLRRLENHLGKGDDCHVDALALQARLDKIIKDIVRSGETMDRHAKLIDTIASLNWLAMEALGVDFNALCKFVPTQFTICYQQGVEPDQAVAQYLHKSLAGQGHAVFLDTWRGDSNWPQEIDHQIKSSDFVIVLLSETSANSEMVQAEVLRACKYHKLEGRPYTLPVRIAYKGQLPYPIAAFLDSLSYLVWRNEADNERLIQEILQAAAGTLPQNPPVETNTVSGEYIVSGNGGPVKNTQNQPLYSPLSAFDPRFLKNLRVPGGASPLDDTLYIEREADVWLKKQMVRRGTTTTIRAPRQTGKTSLLARGIHYAQEQGVNVAFLDLEGFDIDEQTSYDSFLRRLAESICDELGLDEESVAHAWRGSRSAQRKLLRFMENHVLLISDNPIVLAIDEADVLLKTDFRQSFFGLLRSWHNRRATHPIWAKFNMVLVISTEPYLLIDNPNQSPFNVGLTLSLKDFGNAQVSDLNQRHGSLVLERDLPQLIELLNGHPYLTRKALYAMVTQHLTWAELDRVADTDTSPFIDHLRHQYWLLYDKPELGKALKQIIRHEHCVDEMLFFRLLRAGLVKGDNDAGKCRCDLYRRYLGGRL